MIASLSCNKVSRFLILTGLITLSSTSFAATMVTKPDYKAITLKEVHREIDFKKTLHVRVQETYLGYPVLGADAVLHVPKGTMSLTLDKAAALPGTTLSGALYQDIHNDLANTPAYVFSAARAEKAMVYALRNAAESARGEKSSRLMIYIDKNNQARWVFQIIVQGAGITQSYIVDAKTLEILAMSSGVNSLIPSANTLGFKPINVSEPTTNTLESALGGGEGGNGNSKLFYDGHPLPALLISRDNETNTCYFSNDKVDVYDSNKNRIAAYFCNKPDPTHYDLFWHKSENINGGYSPTNDAAYGGKLVYDMFKESYHTQLAKRDGTPLKLSIYVHNSCYACLANDGTYTVGDWLSGDYYPWTSLTVIADLIGLDFIHINTDVDINDVFKQPYHIAIAFAVMTGQAAENYAFSTNSWLYFGNITKSGSGNAINRRFDDPANATNDFGKFEYAFYMLANRPGWSIKKAYEVMLQANRFYWTKNMNFASAACGVIAAAQDYEYETAPVKEAFIKANIDTSSC